jgi:predicted Zn-dependent peptidase
VVKTQDEHLERSIEILSDIMLNSVFKKSEFKKEIDVVIAENTKNADNSATIITDMVDKLIYSGSSYEKPVDTLLYHTKTPFNYNTVLNIYKAFNQPCRMVLISRKPEMGVFCSLFTKQIIMTSYMNSLLKMYENYTVLRSTGTA